MKTLTPFLALALVGCQMPHFGTPAGISATSVISAQAPGTATGGGGTLVGPVNSASPSTQTSETRRAYYPPPVREPLPRYETPPSPVPVGVTTPPVVQQEQSVAPPAPAWIDEKTTTSIGQHQDATGLVKLATVASGKPMLWWLGLCCIAVCVGGLLWSHGNVDGYPVIFWKVGACGVFFLFAGENPLWLLLLLIPIGFYAFQKFGLMKYL